MLTGLTVRVRLLVAAGAVVAGGLLPVWGPGGSMDHSFDRGRNGLWVGHKWFTGREVKSLRRISSQDMVDFVAHLNRHRIRYVYIHAGHITPAGALEDAPGHLLQRLQQRAPHVMFLPWLSGDTSELALDDPAWRAHFLETLGLLRSLGYAGVHLDLEPLRDHHPGYLDLLREIRRHFDGDLFVSHATRRLAPFGRAVGPMGHSFWSGRFYRLTMSLTDQSVLMGYNTALPSPLAYSTYMRHQTTELLEYATDLPHHGVLIGIPAYEHVPRLSDPKVENIRSAVAGVRAALEGRPGGSASFEGVAVYANWLTDPQEWRDYRTWWLAESP